MADSNHCLYTVSEEEKYCFDLRGYLVVPNVLSPDEIETCNVALDHFADKIHTLEAGVLSAGASALAGSFGRRQLARDAGLANPLSRTFPPIVGTPGGRFSLKRVL